MSPSPSPSPSPPQQPLDPNSQALIVPQKPILLAIPVPTNKKPHAVQWTPEETSSLIQAYQHKWYSLNRGQLKAHQWEEVTATLASKCGYQEAAKTSTQCRHKMEKLRKRYRLEKQKGGRSVWPFFALMDQMECGTEPILARPVNMVRFPNTMPKYADNDSEYEDEDQERLKNRSRSINNLLRKPAMVTRFPGAAGYPRTPALPLSSVRRRDELIPSDTDEDDEKLEESKEPNEGGEKRLLFGLAAEMRGFAQSIAKVEKKRTEMIKETEKQRMEMECKWSKMIMDSQNKMMHMIDKWSSGGLHKKMKIRTVSQM